MTVYTEIMKKLSAVNKFILLTFLTALISITAIKFLDARIAAAVMNFIKSVHRLRQATESIPDILPHLVGIGTVFLWGFYFYRSRRTTADNEMRFLRLGATVLPVAYVVKTILKFVFGRTSPRAWLIHYQPIEFHWFKIWSSSFPSGHMLVFVAFGTAVLFYYPKYRQVVLILLCLLGIALIGTDYHFLSDVIAGAYFGFITTYFTKCLFERRSHL
jgi:membrane-associated phospholipid phosphatase